MSKRHKYVITSILLAMGFMGITFLENEDRIIGISLLSAISIGFFTWTLRGALAKNATLLSLVLPPLFTLGVGLFWFLLPSTLYARMPVIALYGIGIYAIASVANVFAVSVQKKIALARAANGVSFVMTLFVAFLLYDAALSLKTEIYFLVALIFIISFLLFLQGLWVSKLTREIGREMIIYSLTFSYLMGVGGLILYFWPVTVVVGSLFLTIAVYVLLGLGQARIEGRLFKQTTYEYLVVGMLVFVLMFLSTSWHG